VAAVSIEGAPIETAATNDKKKEEKK